MRLARSTDGGRAWLRTVTLNDDTTRAPSGHTFHGAVWEGDRDLVVAWLDERGPGPSPAAHAGHSGAGGHSAPAEVDEEGDATVYVARSSDLGATWAAANDPRWGAACPCCRVSLARDPGGRAVASWRKHLPGNVRDIVAGPLDGAEASQVRVHADEWVYPGCPHTGPSVAVDGRGRTHVAWFTGKPEATGIRYARSAAEPSAVFDSATFIVRGTISTAHVAVTGLPGGGSVIAFDRDGSGAARLTVASVGPDGVPRRPVVLAASDGADHPAIAALDDSTAIAAWTRQQAEGSRVQLAMVRIAPR